MSDKSSNFTKALFSSGLSIKTLTLLGFSLVLLPLIAALLFSANQVNHVAQQGNRAIVNVAKLVEANQQLNSSAKNMQRFASQFTVLQEQALRQLYQEHKQYFLATLTENNHIFASDKFTQITNKLTDNISLLDAQLVPTQANDALAHIEQIVKAITIDLQTLEQLSNQLITQQVAIMNNSADDVSSTMLLSLIIIPLSIGIAVIFTLLIQQPLNKISSKIKRLEHGHFEEKIIFSGTKEIKSIANALELMRTRLHSLELQKSSFIRHISHELKTPLAAIREGTELLYDNSVGTLNAEQQEITNIIKHSVSRLQQLIEDLLDFNIVLDSTSLQDSEHINLTELITQAMTLRKLDLQSKALTIEQHCPAYYINSNAKQLAVIIDNLLSNAIKYSPQNGTICITTQKQHQQLLLTISDQGPGITPDIQEKVFDAFYQGPPPDMSTIKSSGLGLTIVKELLMRLQGEIKLTSLDKPKQGLQVTLTFTLNE